MGIQTLTGYSKTNPPIVCCHGDFDVGNVFATEPLTVFDPDPHYGYAYYDVGKSVVLVAIVTGFDMYQGAEQFVEGYFDGEEYDNEILKASIIFHAHLKSSFWHKTNKAKRLERLMSYLENIHSALPLK